MSFISPVTALRRCRGTGSFVVRSASRMAAFIAAYALLLLGAVARYTVASDSGILPSGIPMKCAAC